MQLLAQEMYRVEGLFQQCPPTHPERPKLTRARTAFCGQLNRMVAAACLEMGYPLKQWEWADSKPLMAVAEAYPHLTLEGTEWYQGHLGMMLMAPAELHPWWDLPIHKQVILTAEAESREQS